MPKNHTFLTWESYFYPETIDHTGNGVLRNLLGVKDAQQLAEIENELTIYRMTQWIENPRATDFSYDHFKAIHFHIFQDIYPWAGQERQVGMAKQGHSYYPPGEPLLEAAHHQLASPKY